MNIDEAKPGMLVKADGDDCVVWQTDGTFRLFSAGSMGLLIAEAKDNPVENVWQILVDGRLYLSSLVFWILMPAN